MHVVRHEDDPLGDGEHPQVERLVVQDAEGQSVGLLIRTARLMPADVGRVEGNRDGTKLDVKSADGTPILVGFEHAPSEFWVTFPPGYRLKPQGKPNRVPDVLVKRLGKMSLQDSLSDCGYEVRVSRESGLNIGGEAGPNLGRA
jgi:hypothetical protein